jgi:Protein of unknown function (DUF2490)
MRSSLFLILLFVSTTMTAQIPDAGSWLAIQLPVNLSKSWQWHNDAGYRTLGSSVLPYQFLYRTGARFNFNKKWNTAAGVAFFYTRSSYQKPDHEFGKEFRTWQELNSQHSLSKSVSLQNRLRTEQRWFAETNNRAGYFGLRFRYRVAAIKQINEKWALQLADEYMQQHANKKFSFNQNRIIATALLKLNITSQISGGYMWLRWPGESQHIATFTFQKIISLHGTKNN